MNNEDYILITDDETGKQEIECRECGCVTDMDTYKGEGAQHWVECSKMNGEVADFTGATNEDR